MGKKKRSGRKSADPPADPAVAADAELDRLTKLLTAVMPLHTARVAIKVAQLAFAGTVLAALIGATATIGAAVLKDEPRAATGSPSPHPGLVTAGATPQVSAPPSGGAIGGPGPIVGGLPAPGNGRPADVFPRPHTTTAPRPTTETTTRPPPRPRPTTTAPAVTSHNGTIHDGPHRGTIGWAGHAYTVDVENAGYRSPGDARQGEISASPQGIHSTAGVRIARFRSSAADFGRCADLDYTAMGTFVAASGLAVGDWICADDGVQYLATYQIETVPSGADTYYRLTATSWFRP